MNSQLVIHIQHIIMHLIKSAIVKTNQYKMITMKIQNYMP